MPSIHYLNQPPHPFWDFVANIEDHPFFAAYAQPPNQPPPYASREGVNQGQSPPQPTTKDSEKSEKPAEDQPSQRTRGLGENEKESENTKDKEDTNKCGPKDSTEMPFRGPRGHGPCGGRGRDGAGWGGRHHHRGGHCGGRGGFGGFGRRGPPGGFGGFWGPPPPHHHGHHGPHRGGPPGGFDLPSFLQNLGSQLGINLNNGDSAREGDRNADVDFTPRADVFDTKDAFVVHVSLPGASKEDVGVDWDPETSTLRVAGVVYRPGVDEEVMKTLAVDGRGREVGVFAKEVRLGTRREPANVLTEGITAKMLEGVLVVTVPKAEVEKKEVHFDNEKQAEREMTAETDTTEKGDEVMGENDEEYQPEEEEHEHGEEEGEYVKIDVE